MTGRLARFAQFVFENFIEDQNFVEPRERAEGRSKAVTEEKPNELTQNEQAEEVRLAQEAAQQTQQTGEQQTQQTDDPVANEGFNADGSLIVGTDVTNDLLEEQSAAEVKIPADLLEAGAHFQQYERGGETVDVLVIPSAEPEAASDTEESEAEVATRPDSAA